MAKLTEEEEQLSECYILFELARKVLEKDLMRIDQSPVKLKGPYIHLLERTLYVLSKELYDTKARMKEIGLKVQLNEHDQTFSEYTFFFRGYVLTAKYLNAHLKNQVSKLIIRFFVGHSENERERRVQ
ncbi:hypothetical protein [Evansella cellulosilytica]|uniref:Uncharacterized protein n=1 Tax=Evansella cellulosilytica (strain ATCC 21833 / DSM 2522 / FERM P-1141 / JCM 9156 / N-4) TaxID=649639 RepID=E6U252_EVAC2|nr:hypothetical protein [Evansella cellulosilytica]ADU30430.1 hypothetical protein Bcell_2169 [Evansella cellulosilytica DSM 2522]